PLAGVRTLSHKGRSAWGKRRFSHEPPSLAGRRDFARCGSAGSSPAPPVESRLEQLGPGGTTLLGSNGFEQPAVLGRGLEVTPATIVRRRLPSVKGERPSQRDSASLVGLRSGSYWWIWML